MPESCHQSQGARPAVWVGLFAFCFLMVGAPCGTARADDQRPPRKPRVPNEALPPPVIRRVRGPAKARRNPGPRKGPRREEEDDLEPSDSIAPPARPGAVEKDEQGASLRAPKRPGPGSRAPEPGEVRLRIERPHGVIRYVPKEPGQPKGHARLVMLGNPSIERDAHTEMKDGVAGKEIPALSVKGNMFLVWVDSRGVPEFELFEGAKDGEDSSSTGDADSNNRGASPKRLPVDQASVIPEFLHGIYAEGAVELRFGDQRFRCERLYLDTRTYRGMLVKPRFDGRVLDKQVQDGLPFHVSSKTAVLVGRGRILFEDAEVSTSRANDRIALRVKELTVEEFADAMGEDGAPTPHFLGYQSASTQRYRGKQIVLRGEGVDIASLGEFEFGASDATEGLPTLYRRVRAGSRGRLGRWAFLDFGSPLGPQDDPYADLEVSLGGFTRRGFAAGSTLTWNRTYGPSDLESKGFVEAFGVFDSEDFDRFSTRAPDFRGRISSQSRTQLHDDLTMDVEFHHLSDRGFQREFFEREFLEHKDRESYVRMQWRPSADPTTVANLTYKWHQRPFVTETTLEPMLSAYTASLPLLTPMRRGGLGVDVTSESHAGYLRRRFDEDLGARDYGSWRASNDTRIHAGMNIGNLRWSGYVGGSADWYRDRSDGGSDLTRGALLAGTRLNAQLNRVWHGASGTWMQLNGLRHIVDADFGYEGRFLDSHERTDVPYFDERELREGRQALVARTRQRFQTRRGKSAPVPGEAPKLRTLLDLELAYKYWIDDVGPFGRTSPGAIEIRFSGEPREGYSIFGEAEFDLKQGLEMGALGVSSYWDLLGKRVDSRIGVRHVRDWSTSIDLSIDYRFSPRYSVRIDESYDFLEERYLTRVTLRRYSDDHRFDIGVQLREGGLQFQVSFEPTLGGRDPVSPLFEDEPALSLDGILPR